VLHEYNTNDNTDVMTNWYANYRKKPHLYDWTIGQFRILNRFLTDKILEKGDISNFIVVDYVRGTVPLTFDFYWRLIILCRQALIDKTQRISTEDINEMEKFLNSLDFLDGRLLSAISRCLHVAKLTDRQRLEAYKMAKIRFDDAFRDPFDSNLLFQNLNYRIYKCYRGYVAVSRRISPAHVFAFTNLRVAESEVIFSSDLQKLLLQVQDETTPYDSKSLSMYLENRVRLLMLSQGASPYLGFAKLQITVLRRFPRLISLLNLDRVSFLKS
jgi:hypothetical protein